uniref:(northern house mosquito) hypothetical protein n=1 Tax=Culex pipiens TaxID=7175 RepID=A0A8D8AF45_CULPI
MQCQAENQRRSGVPRVGSRRQEVPAVREASDRREGQTKGRKEEMLHFIMHQKTIPSKRTTRFVFECTHPIRASLTFLVASKGTFEEFYRTTYTAVPYES